MKQLTIVLLFFLSFLPLSCLTGSSNGNLTTYMSDEELAAALAELEVCPGFTTLITSGGGPESRRRNFESCLRGILPPELFDENKNLHKDYADGENPYASLSNAEYSAVEQCYCPNGGRAIPILVQNPVRGGVRDEPHKVPPGSMYEEEHSSPGTPYDEKTSSPGTVYDENNSEVGDGYHKDPSSPGTFYDQ